MPTRRVSIAAACAGLASLVCALGSCGSETPAEPAAVFDEPDQVYSGVRGIIRQLPGANPASPDLQIHHEQIPTFSGADGKVHVNSDGTRGMRAMVMPFPVAPGVSLDGYEPGDKVEFEFQVVWGDFGAGRPTARWQLTQIAPLAEDTPIDLGGEAGEASQEQGSPADTDEPAATPDPGP